MSQLEEPKSVKEGLSAPLSDAEVKVRLIAVVVMFAGGLYSYLAELSTLGWFLVQFGTCLAGITFVRVWLSRRKSR